MSQTIQVWNEILRQYVTVSYTLAFVSVVYEINMKLRITVVNWCFILSL